MILLDTNVVSEMMRLEPASNVKAWFDAQIAETLYLSSVTCAELWLGIALLPPGKRRQNLDNALERTVTMVQPRILPFDEAAARAYAELNATAQAVGHAVSISDGQIAAIAKTHGFAVATRDTMPFEAAGLTVINPWKTATA